MVSDRGFIDWSQACHAHDHLLHSRFMLKPFVLDVSSPAYEKQFEHCKLDQALLGNNGRPRDYMRPGSHPSDASNSPADLQHHESDSRASSPRYNPYPKPSSSSFQENSSR